MRLLWTFATVIATALPALASAHDPWPQRWLVTFEGGTGLLEIHSVTADHVDATILGAPAVGWLADDVLVLRRDLDSGSELWQAHIGRRIDQPPFLAGTISRDRTVAPFYAVAVAAQQHLAPPPTTESNPRPTPALVAVPPAQPTPQPQRSTELTGFDGPWLAPEGKAVVRREGRSIEVIMPDGSSHQGRMTGEATFVVGLGVACCKGELEGPDTVRWENGKLWRRAH